jgi:hypothetical protein
MEDVRNSAKIIFFAAALFIVFLLPRPAAALGIDMLGDVAEPIIGPTKEKLKGLMVYVWLRPYAGYGKGSSDQTRIHTGGITKTSEKDLDVEGFLYGGRGGIMLIHSLRLGIDYSVQTLERNTLVETASGTYVRQSTKGKNTMVGATVGFDIPYTPLQGFGTKYFKATTEGDGASGGDGWGAGINFVVKSPFILSLEMRKLNYSSAPDASGKSAEGSINQYYANLNLMLS